MHGTNLGGNCVSSRQEKSGEEGPWGLEIRVEMYGWGQVMESLAGHGQ